MKSKQSFWVRHFGGSFLGTRNWLLISILFLLGIALVGGFASGLLPAVVFSVIVIGLKVGALSGFLAAVSVGIKALVDDYTQKAANKKEYFWLPYLQDKFNQDFLPWLRDFDLNFIELLVGYLLLAAVITVLVCTCWPAIGIIIPGVPIAMNFLSAAFGACNLFGGSWFFTAAVLGVGTMLAYDVFWRLINVCVDAFSRTSSNDYEILSDNNLVYQELPEISDKKATDNSVFGDVISKKPDNQSNQNSQPLNNAFPFKLT